MEKRENRVVFDRLWCYEGELHLPLPLFPAFVSWRWRQHTGQLTAMVGTVNIKGISCKKVAKVTPKPGQSHASKEMLREPIPLTGEDPSTQPPNTRLHRRLLHR